jgi:hypothetical protein
VKQSHVPKKVIIVEYVPPLPWEPSFPEMGMEKEKQEMGGSPGNREQAGNPQGKKTRIACGFKRTLGSVAEGIFCFQDVNEERYIHPL